MRTVLVLVAVSEEEVMKQHLGLAGLVVLLAMGPAAAQDKIKIGVIVFDSLGFGIEHRTAIIRAGALERRAGAILPSIF